MTESVDLLSRKDAWSEVVQDDPIAYGTTPIGSPCRSNSSKVNGFDLELAYRVLVKGYIRMYCPTMSSSGGKLFPRRR